MNEKKRGKTYSQVSRLEKLEKPQQTITMINSYF
jgi:hypothetical protein